MVERISKSRAAAIARCCEKSIERAVSNGELTAVHEHGRVLIDEADVRRWVEARQVGSRRRATALSGALDYRRRVFDLETGTEAR